MLGMQRTEVVANAERVVDAVHAGRTDAGHAGRTDAVHACRKDIC